MTAITIALDAMGGDYGHAVVLPASLLALKAHPQLNLILVGDEVVLTAELAKLGAQPSGRLQLHHASQVVTMCESPSKALRGKKDSSMRVAINLVKDGVAAACVSSGNTGALMAIAKFVLKTLPGIDRPAIISELPTLGKPTRVLDLGANVDSCAEHLLQFAVMGSVLVAAVDKIESPTVGLLNIGVEEIKGNDQVKRTSDLLAANQLVNYVGYVEGDTIYKGTVDLVVCDGFVGNIALKASEGLCQLLVGYIKQSFDKNPLTKLAKIMSARVLQDIKKQIEPSNYNGASFLGLNGIVIKSHGGADVAGFANAIEKALLEVDSNVPRLIGEKMSDLLSDGSLI